MTQFEYAIKEAYNAGWDSRGGESDVDSAEDIAAKYFVENAALAMLDALKGIVDTAQIDADDCDLALEALSDIRAAARDAIAQTTDRERE